MFSIIAFFILVIIFVVIVDYYDMDRKFGYHWGYKQGYRFGAWLCKKILKVDITKD